MNKEAETFYRTSLKEALAWLPDANQRVFKLMYGRDNGKCSVAEAESMDINDIVDTMPPEKLDWALTQVHNTKGKR